jgi:O-antigen/teichoic acid export membrane protein
LYFKKLVESQYVKNFIALAGSEVISQLIIIGVMPFLLRIYTPMEFGQYEFYKTTALLFVVVGFLNYDVSVYSANNRTERINSILLSAFVLTCICLLTSAFLFVFNDIFVKYTGCEIKEGWFWTLPVYAFFAALTNLILIVLTRGGSFRIISYIKITVSILAACTQLFFGWLNWGYWGLVYSTIMVQIIAFLLHLKPFYKEFKGDFKFFSISNMKSILRNYWRLPLIVFPGNFINNLVQSLPVFFLGRIDSQILGYYALAQRIIGFPLKFVTASVQRLYVKELTSEIEKTGIGLNAYKKNLKIYGIIAIAVILGLLVFTKPLLPILFGNKWLPAVPFVMALGILFSVRFIFGGLSFIMVIGKAPKVDIFWQVFFAISMTLSFIVCEFFDASSFVTILIYVSVGVFSYFIYGFLGYSVAKSRKYLIN